MERGAGPGHRLRTLYQLFGLNPFAPASARTDCIARGERGARRARALGGRRASAVGHPRGKRGQLRLANTATHYSLRSIPPGGEEGLPIGDSLVTKTSRF